ncbi:MAG TPA: hypothetical protein VJ898_10175 [Natrialbaceae archaeon]|nr:hypothetical protein [Natrialbaceae archaeon]
MDDIDRLRLTIRRSTAVVVFALALVGVIVHDAAFVVHGYYPSDAPDGAYLLAMVVLVGSAGYLLFSPFVASVSSGEWDSSRNATGTDDGAED